LWEISKNPGLKVTELAKAMSLHHSTASSLLNKMAKKGLIKRERIHQDQRLVTVILTLDGIQLINQTQVPPQGILQHALFNLPEPVLKSLSKNLDALVKEMDIKDEMAAMEPLNPLAKRLKSLQNE
jgi:DNA-binding MarR family transcriptional regulator